MPIIKLNDLEVLRNNNIYIFDSILKKNINVNSYLSIVATNDCQMNCVYCINSHTNRDLELPLDKALINIKNLVSLYNIKECVILGGEPLLYKDIFRLISGLHNLHFEKIVLTTNGISFCDVTSNNTPMYLELFKHGLSHLNISVHNESEFIDLVTLHKIYNDVKLNYPSAKIRINTNVWRGNHDTVDSLIDWVNLFMFCSDSIRVSNLIYKDSFSVNSKNNASTMELILSDEEYNQLFNNYIDHYSAYLTCIDNPTTLGFVDYTMIPLKSVVIINRNIDSKVSEQVCENEDKHINTFKCLVSGDISLSWNTNNIIPLNGDE